MRNIAAKLIFIALLISNISWAQDKINWIHFDELEAKMAEQPKKVMVDVYTNWCGPCKMMMARTFTNPKVIAYVNEHYYAVKLNAEGPDPITFKGTTYSNPQYDPTRGGRNGTHELTYAIAPVNGRIAYPTIVYMNEEFQIISPVQGFMTPQQVEPILKFVASEAYLTEDWQEYQQNFKGEF
ncbi:MAG: thioredoxin family protein [Crocinitomicaceae bacterium]|nr:thioredoxin family protein [Crocinitomicaceae bacterium]|tara:strand:+ start:389 stop:934 length:546 start_codon:yes stop_codon:yes gene_type:complete